MREVWRKKSHVAFSQSNRDEMKLVSLRISNFQSFGESPTEIFFEPATFLLGPNGSGKTVVLQSLARMFATDFSLRRIQPGDFHVADHEVDTAEDRALWIEADFEFAELKDAKGKHPTVPSNFAHMRLETKDGAPRVRFRLEATKDVDGEIEESFCYVLEEDDKGNPKRKKDVHKNDRFRIQLHYLPARRDPNDHISYSASALLGRILRAAKWADEQSEVAELTEKLSSVLSDNDAILGFNQQLSRHWGSLHTGSYYSDPSISFERSEIDSLLRWGFRRRRTLIPGGTQTAFRAEGEQFSERSDAGSSIV
jgi:putative ATP-dependent endonuclease of the OLD family